MKISHQRTGLFCIVLALLGIAAAQAGEGPEIPPPTIHGPGPIIDGDNHHPTNHLVAFRGTWTLHPPYRQVANTSGALVMLVTTEGQVFGKLWTGEESESFDGFMNSDGVFHLPLEGSGHIRGKIDGGSASGKILQGRYSARWTAARVYTEVADFHFAP